MRKNLCLALSLLGLSSVAFGDLSLEEKRCSQMGVYADLDMGTLRGYNTLKWANKCMDKLPQYSLDNAVGAHARRRLKDAWDMANDKFATNNGTHFPENTDSDYDDVRIWVSFPVFRQEGGGTDNFWRAPFTDPETKERIDRGDCSLVPPDEYKVAVLCPVGCFAPETNLLVFDDREEGFVWLPFASTYLKSQNVAAVSAASSLENISFVKAPVKYWMTDLVDTVQHVLSIRTASQKSIRVSPTHPLVDGEGYVVNAKDLRVGNALLDYQGAADPIEAIKTEQYFGKVYNLDLKESDDYLKVIAANGLLSGTHWYQVQRGDLVQRAIGTRSLGNMLQEYRDGLGGGQ